ncbi:MAG: hypothetical protein QOD74_3107 [Variibacter sp.]|jgi:RimJ/RimL family protein N-acetyltransferase|nr:hypothetical protein [Variibacter sp.]
MPVSVPEDLRAIAAPYEFKPFRNYRAFSSSVQLDVLVAELSEIFLSPDAIVCVAGQGSARSVAIGRRLPWDSEFFGVPMGKIDYVLGADHTMRAEALRLIAGEFRARKIRHVATRADAADSAMINALQDCGFRLRGATATYVARPNREPARLTRMYGQVRAFAQDDAAELIDLASQSFDQFENRFRADPHLPPGRARAFYQEWAQQCVTGQMAELILVSEGREKKLLGFIALRKLQPVSAVAPRPIYGGGLGAAHVRARGAYAGLLHHAVNWAHERSGVAEVQTPVQNIPVIKLYEAIGLRFRNLSYAFHHWRE